jgi:hypothetical protein
MRRIWYESVISLLFGAGLAAVAIGIVWVLTA